MTGPSAPRAAATLELGVLDRAPCGFLRCDDDGHVVAVNATLLERLGYERDEVVGHHLERLLTVGSRIFYQTHLFPLLALHGRAQEIFLLLKPSAGDDVAVLLNAVRREFEGRFVNDLVTMEVVERRKFEDALLRARQEAEGARAELERANAQLRVQAEQLQAQQALLQAEAARADEANRAKSNFLARMSHELRTPLNAIGGYVELITLGIHGPVTDAQREALERIGRSERHLLRLINDVLNLARIEAGRVEYRVRTLVVTEVLDAILPMIEPQLRARQLAFETHVPARLAARADEEKLQQILLNLITNAVKFTPAGGRVTVDAERRSGSGAIAIRVRDTGIGIPADKQQGIFQPFVQVGADETRSAEGTGLGLAISRDLARGMSGDLTVESIPGRGSTFT